MNTPRQQRMSTGQSSHVFISHATADNGFVKELRDALEGYDVAVWVDSRNLRGGDKLPPEIVQAIETARQFIVVLSQNTVNSGWVRWEINAALEVEQRCKDEGYRVIPLLLPGMTPAALENWFDEEPAAVPIQLGPGGLAEALPDVLAALGERLPTDREPPEQPDAKPLEELVLSLSDPKIQISEGTRRVAATATLAYEPADPAARCIESRRFAFTAPLGPIEAEDLRWYLESYFLWPTGVFKERADAIEKKLPQWGHDLFEAALGSDTARKALGEWHHAGDGAERRFSVEVDSDLPDGASEENQAAAREAAAELFALPWELLHDGDGWLFQGKDAARVRRRLPNRRPQAARVTELPIRILLVSPRPEKDDKGNDVGYIDHRISAQPLVQAVENLGDLVRLTVLTPPAYAALDKALQDAAERKEPFDVVHFDGHGVYDRKLGLGGLCFEDAKDEALLQKRTMEFIDAAKLADLFRRHRVPLVFLEACQTAVAEVNPTASVAASLLEEGVTSVVAMSHSVLVETARRFVEAFYLDLADGARVGHAMLAGQRKLFDDTYRGRIMGAGELRLQDWFVPVIYQEQQDPLLITKIPGKRVRQLEEEKRRLSLGDLPEPPPHYFQGRSRELLTLERLLHRQPWAVVRGGGGAGKTTLAAELARWLTRTGRFKRAAFASLEHHRDARAVLDTLGHQLLPDGDKYSVAQFRDLDEALQPIERALSDRPTIIVLDNVESILDVAADVRRRTNSGNTNSTPSSPPPNDPPPEDPDPNDPPPNDPSPNDPPPHVGGYTASTAIFTLCQRLLDADPATRLVFTTREPLPAPFDQRGRERELGALDRQDAIELVSQVMADEGLVPEPNDPGGTAQEITDLVDAVNRHARALVLLAREVARRGVKATTANLRALTAELERKHPGDRENSLYASVELSLRRLPPESRERINVLGVCQGGIHLPILGMLTGLETDDARGLGIELIEVGLAEDMGYGHLRLDPGLPPYLLGEMATDEADVIRPRWAEAMAQLTRFLYQQLSEDVYLAVQLTLLELPNLLAMLDWLKDKWPPEHVVELAGNVEKLVEDLGRPQALVVATCVREQAAQKLGDWSHARFVTEGHNIDRLLERGELHAAHDAARRLLERCLAAGDAAYPEAAYEIAEAHNRLGRVLQKRGAAEAALEPLAEAQRRYQKLADGGSTSAERMATVAITDTAGCLLLLGRLDEAAAACQESIKRSGKIDDRRQIAVSKAHFGTVRMLQKRYDEALKAFIEARDTFEALGEPGQVASVWHMTGLVHQDTGQFEAAEEALRQSLAIRVRENDVAEQASSLGQLGNLYQAMGRLEEAATFSRQAIELFVRLQDIAGESKSRTNLAGTIIKLKRYDEARGELQRAIECNKSFGLAAEPWKAWSILEDLERATDHPDAAMAARQQAIETYLAYRRAGGVSRSPGTQLFELVAQAIHQNTAEDAAGQLNRLLEPDDPPHFRALVSKLQSLLAGDRDAALATDPELNYGDAAELQLLLEQLSSR